MRAALDTTPELRLGRWQDVGGDLTADAVISDPPFSARTHEGGGRAEREDGYAVDGLAAEYTAWTRDDVHGFVKHWSPRCRGWMVAITDHLLAPHWEAAYDDAGRYAFPPVGIVIRGMSVRLRGDGPSSWTLYALVARPATREFASWAVSRSTVACAWRTSARRWFSAASIWRNAASNGRGSMMKRRSPFWTS